MKDVGRFCRRENFCLDYMVIKEKETDGYLTGIFWTALFTRWEFSTKNETNNMRLFHKYRIKIVTPLLIFNHTV